MSKICQITGKKAMGGCNVSHSKRHTKEPIPPQVLLGRTRCMDRAERECSRSENN